MSIVLHTLYVSCFQKHPSEAPETQLKVFIQGFAFKLDKKIHPISQNPSVVIISNLMHDSLKKDT